MSASVWLVLKILSYKPLQCDASSIIEILGNCIFSNPTFIKVEYKWGAIIALVFCVTLFSISLKSICGFVVEISINTGIAPTLKIAVATPTQVRAGKITSSPIPIFKLCIASNNADEPFAVKIAWLDLVNCSIFFSAILIKLIELSSLPEMENLPFIRLLEIYWWLLLSITGHLGQITLSILYNFISFFCLFSLGDKSALSWLS